MSRRWIATAAVVAALAAWWGWQRDVPVEPEEPVAPGAPVTPPSAVRLPVVPSAPLRATRVSEPAEHVPEDGPDRAICHLGADIPPGAEARLWFGRRRGRPAEVQGGVVVVPMPHLDRDVREANKPIRVFKSSPGETPEELEERIAASDARRRAEGELGPLEGRLVLPGVGEADVRLVPGDTTWSCEPGAFTPYAFVTGRVRSDGVSDFSTTAVMGCGGWARADRDGGFYLEARAQGRCEVRAIRRDGAFPLRSDAVEVDPVGGADVVLDLDLPPWEASGVGVVIREHELGIAVSQVVPDSPAEDAGLRVGDVIVALDGWDAVDLDTTGFQDVAIGPPGTEVVYTVLRGDEEVDVVMEREPMDPIR